MNSYQWLREGALTFLLASFSLACSNPIMSLKDPGDPLEEAHDDVVEAWTRSSEIYHGFEVELLAQATFLSLPVRRSLAAFMAERRNLTQEEREKLWKEMEAAEGGGYEFLVSLYVPQRGDNDLTSQDPSWSLTFLGEGERRVEPLEVKARKHNMELKALYPHTDDHFRHYLVRFPKEGEDLIGPATPLVKLRISNALGTAEMIWRVGPSPTEQGDGGAGPANGGP